MKCCRSVLCSAKPSDKGADRVESCKCLVHLHLGSFSAHSQIVFCNAKSCMKEVVGYWTRIFARDFDTDPTFAEERCYNRALQYSSLMVISASSIASRLPILNLSPNPSAIRTGELLLMEFGSDYMHTARDEAQCVCRCMHDTHLWTPS